MDYDSSCELCPEVYACRGLIWADKGTSNGLIKQQYGQQIVLRNHS